MNITEALGEVTLLYFQPSGDHAPVIAKLHGIHKDKRGQTVRLTADPAKVMSSRMVCRYFFRTRRT